MTLPVWPNLELPRPLRAGYQEAPLDGRILSRTEAGYTRLRRRFTMMPRRLSLTFMMSRNERARFERFYEEELAAGALQFLMPDFADDGWPLADDEGAWLATDEGDVLVTEKIELCQFTEQLPAYEVAGLEWRVSFTVEVLP